jgi:hypothetical protein
MRNDNFNEKLEKVIKSLPEVEPNKELWGQIEAQLSFEEKVNAEIINLTEFDINDRTWEKIENRLNNSKKSVRKVLIYSLSAAATIALILGLSGIFNKNQEVKISYSTEQISTDKNNDEEEQTELDPLQFLEQNCLAKAEVCNSPEFKEQKAALLEIENERKNITETINAYGESPELVKSLIKIENLKSEILHDLIKRLNS